MTFLFENFLFYFQFDFAYATWGKSPELVIEMLQSSIKNSHSSEMGREKKSKRSNQEILDELKTPLRPSTRQIISL